MSVKRLLIWYRVLYSLFSTFFGVRCNVLSAEESVKKIQENHLYVLVMVNLVFIRDMVFIIKSIQKN